MVKQNMLRFAIPFHIANYDSLQKEKFKSIEEKYGWERAHIIQGENDLYDYITELAGEKETSAIAHSWKLPKKKYDQELFVSEVSAKELFWKLSDMGLLIFNDELGIFWYEIDTSGIKEHDDFLDLAYALKELSRSDNERNYSVFNLHFNGIDDPKYIDIKKDDTVVIQEIKDTKQGTIAVCKNERNYSVFNLHFNGIDYPKYIDIKKDDTVVIQEIKDTKQGTIAVCKKKIGLYKDVLCKFIPFFDIDSFFSNRWKESGKTLYPDRAIAFSWIYEVVEKKEDYDAYDMAFHLGRTYKSTYEMSSNFKNEDFYVPFDDSLWYGSLEGCGNYTAPKQEKEFFNSGYEGRLNTYYYIYLLCLGQYYSLLQLAHRVSVLPTNEDMYSSKNNILERMMDQIHIFNLKNNYSQIGHLTQHNEFYEYLQNRLGINKMQEELEVELQALFEMIEKKKTIKQEKNNRVITIIGGIFVVLQAFINVAAMYDSVISKDWGYFAFATAGSFVLVVLGIIIWLIGRIKK